MAAALGYAVGLRKGKDAAYKRTVEDQLVSEQSTMLVDARAYLQILEAIDSERSEDMTNLQHLALTHLRGFVSVVQDLQARDESLIKGEVILQLYTNATIYLAKHPGKR